MVGASAWTHLAGCGAPSGAGPPAHVPRATGEPLVFHFPGVDGDPVTSETLRGRTTALLFLTTYDLASQLLARELGQVVSRFTPRANAVGVVLEAPRYAELVPAYRESLGLAYPLVMADFATREGRGPFGDIQNVPTLVVLDRQGREVWRHQGPLSPPDIEAALRRASPAPPGKRFNP